MMSFARRLRAVLLALVFVGGGGSPLSLDVLLFHAHGEASQTAAHLEPAGGCASHVGHCSVGRPVPAAGALAGSPSGWRPLPLAPSAPRLRPADEPDPASAVSLPRPRAPPIAQSV